jgi:ligand-binding sensor domain-containing protein
MTDFKTVTFFTTLLVTMFLSSCNGQVKKAIPKQETTISVVQPKLIKSQNSNESNNVHSIIQDKEGFIWFATTGDGVYRYDGKTFTNFTTKDGLNSNCVLSMLQDHSGNIWLGTDNGLSRFDGKTFYQIPITTNTNLFYNQPSRNISVSSILQDKKGIFWLACEENGVYNYNGNNFTWFIDKQNINNPNKFDPKTVTNVMEDKKGHIWFTT